MKKFEEISHLDESSVKMLYERGLITSKTVYEYYDKVSVWTRNLGHGSTLWSDFSDSLDDHMSNMVRMKIPQHLKG